MIVPRETWRRHAAAHAYSQTQTQKDRHTRIPITHACGSAGGHDAIQDKGSRGYAAERTHTRARARTHTYTQATTLKASLD